MKKFLVLALAGVMTMAMSNPAAATVTGDTVHC